MIIVVKLFAAARQTIGSETVQVELAGDGPHTIGDVRDRLIESYPTLANLARNSMFALKSEYATDDTPIDAAAEVAWIPPVSGG